MGMVVAVIRPAGGFVVVRQSAESARSIGNTVGLRYEQYSGRYGAEVATAALRTLEAAADGPPLAQVRLWAPDGPGDWKARRLDSGDLLATWRPVPPEELLTPAARLRLIAEWLERSVWCSRTGRPLPPVPAWLRPSPVPASPLALPAVRWQTPDGR